MKEMPKANTITKERIEDLALRYEKPSWLKDVRLAAWEAYLQTPAPTLRDEEWRKTIIDTLDLSALTTFDFGQIEKNPPAFPPCFETVLKHFPKRSGSIYQGTNSPGYLELDAELSAKGVIFCDIGSALAKHAEVIYPYLSKCANIKIDGKFGLLTKALFNCGLFLYVPKGLEIEAPFVSGIGVGTAEANAAGGAVFPLMIVVAEPQSKVNLVHLIGSTDNQAEGKPVSLASSVIDVYAQEGANVNYLELEQFAPHVFAISRSTNEVARDGKFTSMSVAVGGKQVKTDICTLLEDRGASSEVLGIVLGSKDEHYHFNTIQEHNAPDTKSDINFRVALKDASTSMYQGTVKVAKVAQKTDAYQSNKNLLLGTEARADSIPRLEILADDVKCSHGATVGPVDQEQIFYLMSRGLPKAVAEELIVLGFFQKVVDRLTIEGAANWLVEAVSQKICQAGNAYRK